MGALGDKIVLSKMLDNLSVPQMPMVYMTQRTVDRRDVYKIVEDIEKSPDGDEAWDIVVKPTHLSNGEGNLIFEKDRWVLEDGGWNKERLYQHIKKFLNERAAEGESEALKSVIPGFIVQPRYRSVLDFRTPLEIRVVTLWGKTRLGIWWWGKGIQEERRNTWLIRHPSVVGQLGSDDTWEILHEHTGAIQVSIRLCCSSRRQCPPCRRQQRRSRQLLAHPSYARIFSLEARNGASASTRWPTAAALTTASGP